MAKYLHWYNDKDDFEEDYWGGNYVEPWFSITVDEGEKQTDFDREDYKELFKTPLTFEFNEEGGEFYFYYDAITDEYTKTVTYSLNGGPKVQVTPTSENTITVEVEQGDVMQLWGDNATYSHRINSSENSYFFFGSDCEFSVKGNIMSLIHSNGFEKLFSFSREMTFSHLFFGCANLSRADELILPAIELTDRCYGGMFQGCTSLTSAPALPATTLAEGCYINMFDGCTNLTSVPELPATTLAEDCYNSMFRNCTNLTSGPELPATTLATYCYRGMFQGCTSLTGGVTTIGNATAVLDNECCLTMFDGCTSLVQAPELPATALANNCYRYMFSGCTSLTSAPALPATTLAIYCYEGMFQGCTGLTEAPELPATTLVKGCYQYMFSNCTSLTSAPALPATTLTAYCYSYMFFGCRNLTTAPELPAATLATYSYERMFQNCTNLNYIKCLATNISATNSHQNWVSGVQTTSGTFVMSADIAEATWGRGNNGIPTNWTVESDTDTLF